MSTRRLEGTIVLLASLMSSCGEGNSPDETPSVLPEPNPAKQEPVAIESEVPPPLGFSGLTTDGAAALSNLAEQIDENRAAVNRRPDVVGFRRGLVDGLLAQVGFEGRFSALAEVERLTAEGLTVSQDLADGYLLRARYFSAVHRFDDALGMLERAQGVANRSEIGIARRSIAIARGNIDAASWADYSAAVGTPDDYSVLTELAIGYAALGAFQRADELYLAALTAYTNVSPFAVAWVQFQRGVMWAESAAHPEWARPLYEDAVRRLPGHVSANVHLAEIELASGERDAAVSRISLLAETTEDPETMGRLAEWLAQSDPSKAAHYRTTARAKWEALLQREPLAFSDHAAEFYLGAGADPGRALLLAEQNLANRATPRARLLAVKAALAVGDHLRACALVQGTPSSALSANVHLARLVVATRAGCPPVLE
jgi:tetratricopeptide (TPR) repeat protein